MLSQFSFSLLKTTYYFIPFSIMTLYSIHKPLLWKQKQKNIQYKQSLLAWGHPVQSNMNQDKCYAVKVILKVTIMQCALGRNHTNAVSVTISLSRRKHLINYQRVHTGRTYPCSHYNKCFVQNKNLFKHQMIHTEEKLYLCSQCDKYFTQKQKLSED